MRIYFDIIAFNFSRFLAYPVEMWGLAARRTLELGLLILFWWVVVNSSDRSMDFRALVAYFLLTNSLVEFSGPRFGDFLGKVIKEGAINHYLIRPLRIIPYLYSANLGQISAPLLLGAATFGVGLLLNPPAHWWSVGLFLVFTVLALLISAGLGIIIGGVLSFKLVEARSIRHTINHIVRVFSGAMIPLSFFPEAGQNLLMLTPAPYLAYVPVSMLHKTVASPEIFAQFFLGLGWALTLLGIASYLWNKSLKEYEAIGI